MAILKGQCHLGKILICYKAGPVIPKTIVKILKKFFFTLKMSILIKFFVLVVTKMRHLGTNIVMKTHYPEQTLLPKCITRSQTCKLLKNFTSKEYEDEVIRKEIFLVSVAPYISDYSQL